MENKKIKAATIDLYNNERNEGIRCIGEIINETASSLKNIEIEYTRFDTRYKNEIPGLEQDIFISSGGPGSPFEGEGSEWEKNYFNLLEKIYSFNQNNNDQKKYIFFICHSFQMMARFFEFADVTKREFKSFGVMPFMKTVDGENDMILKNLPNPFYAADIREYQVVNPDKKVFSESGAKILSNEILNNDENREPALTAVRISDEIVGTQFHPEADSGSMLYHFQKPDEKKQVIETYGAEHYNRMIELLNEPDAIKLTRKTVLPSFLNNAINQLTKVLI